MRFMELLGLCQTFFCHRLVICHKARDWHAQSRAFRKLSTGPFLACAPNRHPCTMPCLLGGLSSHARPRDSRPVCPARVCAGMPEGGGCGDRYLHYEPRTLGSAVIHPMDASVQTYRGHTTSRTLIRAYFSPAHTTGQRFIYSGDYHGNVFLFGTLAHVLCVLLAL